MVGIAQAALAAGCVVIAEDMGTATVSDEYIMKLRRLVDESKELYEMRMADEPKPRPPKILGRFPSRPQGRPTRAHFHFVRH